MVRCRLKERVYKLKTNYIMSKKVENKENVSNDTIHNVSCRFEFRNIPKRYVSSIGLFIGKVLVAEYFYDGTRTRGDKKQYKVVSPLPTIKNDLGNYETKEECKNLCIKIAKTFLKQLSDNGN